MADQVISSSVIDWTTSMALEMLMSLHPGLVWYQSEQSRMKEANIRDIFYDGDTADYEKEIKSLMDKKFNMTPDDQDAFPIVMLRDTMKMINRLAMVYKQDPVRHVMFNDNENEKLTEQLNELYSNIDFNLIMREANQKMLLHNTVPLRIQFPVNRWGEVEVDISVYSPADTMVAVSAGNYLIPEVVSVREINEDNNNIWRVEDSEFIRQIDYEGKIINTEPNKYGLVRWAFGRYRKGLDFWSGLNADDMISQQKYSSILQSGGIESGTFNLFPIILLKNLGKSEFKRSPRHVIAIEKIKDRQGEIEPGVESVSLQADLEILRKFESDLRMRTALNRNLPRSSVGLDSTLPQSGYQEYLENLPLLEERKQQRACMFRLEKEIFEILKRVSAIDKSKIGFRIPDTARLKIDYAEDNIQLSENEELELWQKKIEMNAATVIDYLIYKNPDLSEEDAIKIFENNKQLNSKYITTFKDIFTNKTKAEEKTE